LGSWKLDVELTLVDVGRISLLAGALALLLLTISSWCGLLGGPKCKARQTSSRTEIGSWSAKDKTHFLAALAPSVDLAGALPPTAEAGALEATVEAGFGGMTS
jgi:hypothetical protein